MNVSQSPRPNRTPFRYRWSHRSSLHRGAVRFANRILPAIPDPIKYAVTNRIRARRVPYSLVTDGSVAVQVGAPRDTLLAGRSRAMAFAMASGPTGQMLVVEPDEASVDAFRSAAARFRLTHVQVVCAAAWSERSTLTLDVDPSHPATNFIEGSTQYSDDELRRFRKVTVPAIPLDDLIEEAHLESVDLVSITTNGAEREILRGLTRTMARGLPYICLARTETSYSELMETFGYQLVDDDDRGFTFRRRDTVNR